MLLQLPQEVLKKILHCVHGANHTPSPSPSPSLLSLYCACKAMKQAMLPLIGSTRLLLAEETGRPGGRAVFAQGYMAQLSRFPSAATLRVLYLEIGLWADELADAMLAPEICQRLAGVVDLFVMQPGDSPGRPTHWRVICGMIAMVFPMLRRLALMMDVKPSLFVVRHLHRLVGSRGCDFNQAQE